MAEYLDTAGTKALWDKIKAKIETADNALSTRISTNANSITQAAASAEGKINSAKDDLQKQINAVKKSVVSAHAYVNIRVTSPASKIIEKGKSTSITVTADAAAADLAPTSITISNNNGITTPPAKVSNSKSLTTTTTATDTIKFTAKAVFDNLGTSSTDNYKEASVTVSAYYPIYALIGNESKPSGFPSNNEITLSNPIPRTIKSSAKGTYEYEISTSNQYFWLLVPDGVEKPNAAKEVSGGFGVTLNQGTMVIKINGSNGTTYTTYRCAEPMSEGTLLINFY